MIGSNSAEVPAGFVNAQNKDELFSLFGKMKEEAKQVYDEDGKTEFGQILSMVNNRNSSKNVEKEDTISSVSSQESGTRKKIKMKKPMGSSKNSNGKFVLDL